MSATWKKTAKCNQKEHRERHQPESRKHLGLLEKKKDYVKRANDRQKKETLMKILRKKALAKNPDEFYMHMVNSKIVRDEHIELTKRHTHTPEQLKLMQTKDMRYVEFKRNIESKKIDKIQSTLHMIDMANKVKNTHVFYVDSAEEVKKFDLADRLDTYPQLLDRKTNRIRKQDLQKMVIPEIKEEAIQKRNEAYEELEKRIHREKELSIVQQKLQMKKNLVDKRKEKPKLVKPGTKETAPIYKWDYVRKR